MKCSICKQEKGIKEGHDDTCCECGYHHWACEPCWGAAIATGHVRVRAGWWNECPSMFVIPPAPVIGNQAAVGKRSP